MALTLQMQQKLESVELHEVFEEEREKWLALVKQSYAFVTLTYPEAATIRRDDVAKALIPVLEVDEGLQEVFSKRKLKQRYWFEYFAHYIIEKTWDEVT